MKFSKAKSLCFEKSSRAWERMAEEVYCYKNDIKKSVWVEIFVFLHITKTAFY